jgi:hypothetical protein
MMEFEARLFTAVTSTRIRRDAVIGRAIVELSVLQGSSFQAPLECVPKFHNLHVIVILGDSIVRSREAVGAIPNAYLPIKAYAPTSCNWF